MADILQKLNPAQREAVTATAGFIRVIAGAADGASVKVAKAAISGAVPVVGGIIAEASETVPEERSSFLES